MAIAPVQVGPDTPSESLVSQSHPRGRDLEAVFYVTRVLKFYPCKQKATLNPQSWKHLALVQSGILHEPGKELRVRAVERLPFCTLGWVPEHEATLLRLNPTSNDDF